MPGQAQLTLTLTLAGRSQAPPPVFQKMQLLVSDSSGITQFFDRNYFYYCYVEHIC
jgi:hypothetical protein